MATVTSNVSNKSVTLNKNSTSGSTTITWTAPTVPTGGTITAQYQELQPHSFNIRIAYGAGTVTAIINGETVSTVTKKSTDGEVNGNQFLVPPNSEVTFSFIGAVGYVLSDYAFDGTGGGSENPLTVSYDYLVNYDSLYVDFIENADYIKATKVTVDPEEVSLAVGENRQLSFTMLPTNASYPAVYWDIDNTNIATINDNGVITGLAVGEAIVCATSYDGQVMGYANVVVTPFVYIQNITLSFTNVELNINESKEITYSYTPSNALDDISFTSSNSSIATVTNGVIKGVTEGNCTITVYSRNNSSIKQIINVAVKKAITMLSFAPTGETYIKGTNGNYTDTLSKFNLQSISEDSSNIHIDTARRLHTSELVVCNSINESTRLIAVKDEMKTAINENGIDNISLTSNDYNQFPSTLSSAIATYKSCFDTIDTIVIDGNSSVEEINTLISYLPTCETVTETITMSGVYIYPKLPMLTCRISVFLRETTSTSSAKIGALSTGDKVQVRKILSTATTRAGVLDYRDEVTTASEADLLPLLTHDALGYVTVVRNGSNTYTTYDDTTPIETQVYWKSTIKSGRTIRKFAGVECESMGTVATGEFVYVLDDMKTYSGTIETGATYQWYHIYSPSQDIVGYVIVQALNTITPVEGTTTKEIVVQDKTLDLTRTSVSLEELNLANAMSKGWSVILPDTLTDFYGGEEYVTVARTYQNNRDEYLTYNWTNIMTGVEGNEIQKTWQEVTIQGADSPDGLYRNLDCSGLSGISMRGIPFEEVYLSQAVYESANLTPRTSTYDWATAIPRTAGEQCQFFDEKGWMIDKKYWHSSLGAEDWEGLQEGDLLFYGGKDNGRYLGVYHVAIYAGKNSSGLPCVIECTSSDYVSKHTDGLTKSCTVITMAKKGSFDNICRIARPQYGTFKKK